MALAFQAVPGQGGHFGRAAAAVAQDDVDGAEHRPHLFGVEVSVVGVDGEGVELGVELADDVLGDGPADLVFVDVLLRDAARGVAGEYPRCCSELTGESAEARVIGAPQADRVGTLVVLAVH